MPVSEQNTRTQITIPKDLKKALEELAKAEHRSFNNYVITILWNHVNSLPR